MCSLCCKILTNGNTNEIFPNSSIGHLLLNSNSDFLHIIFYIDTFQKRTNYLVVFGCLMKRTQSTNYPI